MQLFNRQFLILMILILCFSRHAIATDINQNLSEKISDERIAVLDKAIALTGFYENRDECKISADDIKCIVFEDSTTPFLGEYAKKRPVWHISFRDINLKSRDGQPVDKEFDRDFDVYIDSLTGHLLKITCFYGSTTPDECPELSAEEAEKQLMREQYIGFPDKIPPVSFSDAILAGINPFNAKQILGQYIMYSHHNLQPRPVWIISFCGPPMLPIVGGEADWIPKYQRSRARQIVDDTSGRVIIHSSSPTVPLKPEDRERIYNK